MVVEELEDDSSHGPDPTGPQPASSIEGTAATHNHPPSPAGYSNGPQNQSFHTLIPANRRTPPFPLPPHGDAITADAHNRPAVTPAAIQGPPSVTKGRNPRRRRRFMRWVKKFAAPWSGISPHDPNHGKKAAKLATNQGLFHHKVNKEP